MDSTHFNREQYTHAQTNAIERTNLILVFSVLQLLAYLQMRLYSTWMTWKYSNYIFTCRHHIEQMKFVWITIVQETMSRIEIEFAKYTNTHIHKEKKKCIQEKVQRYYKKKPYIWCQVHKWIYRITPLPTVKPSKHPTLETKPIKKAKLTKYRSNYNFNI